ncbi:YkgJ family cysteine cluster protein (plasmid) [Klebsiella michiganensis]|uniref:YkgJ family cysteine cluster protein n=1 Tax=Klebsiella michiganensis TaxID=1134687 RepID=A0A6P1V7T0_9ENTR|nr:YkgJ family cysteine cluster protein [Klebsiella michiganensis]QHS48776.1 YkgJ family cysteine cluster protein [Klebsiella michiganensis]QHS49719.1 YkgJ family cysteine cluster protein [Klebsiella michiganensis]
MIGNVLEEYISNGGVVPVCKKGCSACCNLHVSLLTPVVFYISEMIEESFSESQVYFIKKKLLLRTKISEKYGDDTYRAPCVFLGKTSGQCLIYDFHPGACRRFVSGNIDICNQFAGSAYSGSKFTEILSVAVYKNGLFMDSHEMNRSLFMALSDRQLYKRWLAGEKNIFPGVAWERFADCVRVTSDTIGDIKVVRGRKK